MNINRTIAALATAVFMTTACADDASKHKPTLYACFDYYSKDIRCGKADGLHFGPTTTVILGHPNFLREKMERRADSLYVFYLPTEQAKKRVAVLLNACGTDRDGNTFIARRINENEQDSGITRFVQEEVDKQTLYRNDLGRLNAMKNTIAGTAE